MCLNKGYDDDDDDDDDDKLQYIYPPVTSAAKQHKNPKTPQHTILFENQYTKLTCTSDKHHNHL